MLIYKRVGFLVFFLALLWPPFFGLLFIQLFDLSIQLYIVGVSHAVLTDIRVDYGWKNKETEIGMRNLLI